VTLTVLPAELQAYAVTILSAAGLPGPDADVVAAALIDANLRGIDSHGVTRIPIYVDRLRRGLVNPEPDVRVIRDSGAALLVDGDNGMGAVVTSRAMAIALERLRDVGSVSVAVRNTNHYSSGAYYMGPALERGAVAFLYANGIPEGWAVDAAGNPTTDAQAALEGAVLPFGGPKGYGIAMMIEVLAGVMSGANIPIDQFLARIDAFIDDIKATGSPESGHEVLVPGEIESRTAAARARDGVPLSPDVVQALERVAPAGLAVPQGVGSGRAG
jgi:LDH2 family malate/lactate/ureidoglycolate dehydrogenase